MSVPASLTDDVSRRLRELIVRGELAPDRRLREVSLATMLGVSRTPIRAALGALAQEGLVAHEPNRGYRVRRFTLADILNAYRVRSMLEGLACRIAAEQGLATPVRRRLERALAHYETRTQDGSADSFDRVAVVELNHTFHTTILRQSGNPMLIDFVQHAQRLPLSSLKVIPHADRRAQIEGAQKSHAEHLAVFAAICRRDPDEAEQAMRAHIDRAAGEVAQLHRDSILDGAAVPAPARAPAGRPATADGTLGAAPDPGQAP